MRTKAANAGRERAKNTTRRGRVGCHAAPIAPTTSPSVLAPLLRDRAPLPALVLVARGTVTNDATRRPLSPASEPGDRITSPEILTLTLRPSTATLETTGGCRRHRKPLLREGGAIASAACTAGASNPRALLPPGDSSPRERHYRRHPLDFEHHPHAPKNASGGAPGETQAVDGRKLASMACASRRTPSARKRGWLGHHQTRLR